MRIHFITSNRFKLEVAEALLARHGIAVEMHPMDLDEVQSSEVEEVAMHKAEQALRLAKHPFIVDDSGFYITALKGFPGAYLKHVINMVGWEGVLKLLGTNKDRRAMFRAILVFGDPDTGKTVRFSSRVPGIISRRPYGSNNMRMLTSKIFIPNGSSKTIAQMNAREWHAFIYRVEKERYSKFAAWLKKEYGPRAH